MPIDQIVLVAVGVIGVAAGLYLLTEAKNYRARRHGEDVKHHQGTKHA